MPSLIFCFLLCLSGVSSLCIGSTCAFALGTANVTVAPACGPVNFALSLTANVLGLQLQSSVVVTNVGLVPLLFSTNIAVASVVSVSLTLANNPQAGVASNCLITAGVSGLSLNPLTNILASNTSLSAVIQISCGSATCVGTTSVSSFTCSPNPSLNQAAVNLNIALTQPYAAISGLPDGSCTFYQGSNALSNVAIVKGIATLSASLLDVGNQNITIVYPGAVHWKPIQASLIQIVKALSLCQITSIPSVSGIATPITVTIPAPTTGSVKPTGSCSCFDGGNSLGTFPLINGALTFNPILTAGTHNITVVYGGDTFYSSVVNYLLITILKGAATVTLTSSSVSIGIGQIVTLTAKVASSVGIPTGLVVFLNRGVAIGASIALGSGGLASLSVVLPVGTNSITCNYLGDLNYLVGSSVATVVTILKAAVSITVTPSITSPLSGQPITVTVTLSAPSIIPSGSCTLLDGATSIKTVIIISGVAIFPNITLVGAGIHNLTITYPGDNNCTGSTGSTSCTVSKEVALVTVTATCQTVVLKAQLAPVGSDTPTGSVIFYNAGVSLGTATITSGVATLTATLPAAGLGVVTYKYSGDSNFVGN